MIAVTALTTIRYNGERHVPDSPNADFEADEKTAHSLVRSGAAKYSDPDQVAPDDSEDTGTSTATGSAGAGSEGAGSEGGSGGNLDVKVEVADPDAAKAALAAAAAATAATTSKPAAKTAAKPAAKTAAKKTATKKK